MARLPGILGEIEDVAGQAAALQLARARGGTEMKFSAKPGGVLAKIVGDEAAAKIVELFGPQKYAIPMATVRGRAGRQAAAAQLLAQGKSANAVAMIADVHERTVRRVREKMKESLPLFGDE